MKKNLVRYGLLLLCLIPCLFLINYFMRDWNSWGVIGIDVAVGVVIMALLNYLFNIIAKKIAEKKEHQEKSEKVDVKEKANEEVSKKENLGIKKNPKQVIKNKKVKK